MITEQTLKKYTHYLCEFTFISIFFQSLFSDHAKSIDFFEKPKNTYPIIFKILSSYVNKFLKIEIFIKIFMTDLE